MTTQQNKCIIKIVVNLDDFGFHQYERIDTEMKRNRQTRVYGYCRVSTLGQVNGDGLKRQKQVIQDYCKKNCLKLEKMYEEKGVSGTILEREQLTRLFLDLKNSKNVNTIIIERIDRLSRDLIAGEYIIKEIRKHGATLISVNEGENLLDDNASRELIRRILGAVSEYDKKMIVEKLRLARERVKREKGKCEGRKSYKEVRPELYKRIKKLRRYRKGIGHRSYSAIARILNTEEYKTLTGRAFTAQNVRNICLF